jgi:hypothetical protein
VSNEEDRAANEWLAGNNAAGNSSGAGLHGATLALGAAEIKLKEKRRPRRTANRFGGEQIKRVPRR